MATITLSVSMVFVAVSSNDGLNPPSSSKTEVHRISSTPTTLSPLLRNLFGPQETLKIMPSSKASWISGSCEGISSLDSRHTSWASFAPRRRALIATSMATPPPPITTTLSPILTSFPKFAWVKNSTAWEIPFRFSPSMPSFLLFWVPIAMNTALYPRWKRSFIVMSLPIVMLVLILTPSDFRYSISASTVSLGNRKSGMHLRNIPPASGKDSKTVIG